jgi:hypothetical protein
MQIKMPLLFARHAAIVIIANTTKYRNSAVINPDGKQHDGLR